MIALFASLRFKAAYPFIVAIGLVACGSPAFAQAAKPPKEKEKASPLGALGGNNKDPIKIDADRLDVFDKENRAVFTGNVLAVQGESTMRCTVMTVFYEQQKGKDAQTSRDGQAKDAQTKPATPSANDSSIKKIDCKGPVTVVSKTQVATGDNAVFDRVVNNVVLTGNVALSDGPNVTRGDRIVYDVNTGIANVEVNPGGRVKALFVPGSNDPKEGKDKAAGSKPAAKTN